jgi:hypothetical protein
MQWFSITVSQSFGLQAVVFSSLRQRETHLQGKPLFAEQFRA